MNHIQYAGSTYAVLEYIPGCRIVTEKVIITGDAVKKYEELYGNTPAVKDAPVKPAVKPSILIDNVSDDFIYTAELEGKSKIRIDIKVLFSTDKWTEKDIESKVKRLYSIPAKHGRLNLEKITAGAIDYIKSTGRVGESEGLKVKGMTGTNLLIKNLDNGKAYITDLKSFIITDKITDDKDGEWAEYTLGKSCYHPTIFPRLTEESKAKLDLIFSMDGASDIDILLHKADAIRFFTDGHVTIENKGNKVHAQTDYHGEGLTIYNIPDNAVKVKLLKIDNIMAISYYYDRKGKFIKAATARYDNE